ncbi:TPA: hypothetical protein ACMY33_001442 [Yersinia enterocolitica]|nr:hypothetical protein [Yersinia enterocolitica]HEB1852773.1 hypothetical protein [Yersinia enterocolitica]
MLSKEEIDRQEFDVWHHNWLCTQTGIGSYDDSKPDMLDAWQARSAELLSLREQLDEQNAITRRVSAESNKLFDQRNSLYEQLEALKALPPAGETCWSCSKYFTYLQHAECDGFCPHCNAEVELTPPALAVPDVRAIEDNLIELVGLMCDRATNIYEQDAYGQAYCILKYGVLPYLRKQGK